MKYHALLTALLALSLPVQAGAELPVGAEATGFTTQAAKAGKARTFSLRTALAKGPVVLYFYPKAFTHGCTLEARAFAASIGEFEAAGATVLGMSADGIDTLKRFSLEECAGKFAVGVASASIIDAYDVVLARDGQATGLSNRTSYVIAQNGRIAFVHSDSDYRDHVKLTLSAVKRLKMRK